MAKRMTFPLRRLHIQPGFCLVQIDKEDERVGRVVGFPAGPKGKFKIADAEAIVDLDECSVEIDVTSEDVELGRLAIMPIGKVLAFVAPEPAQAVEAPKLVLP